jgi:diguanylate cyclase (GGDEF)-like protein/PAS domain S-box-containing protein
MSNADRPSTPFDEAVYKTLLESTKAIPWKIDWSTKEFTYIGPQIETLLGWERSSWKTVQDWMDRMHPDDRVRVFEYCVSQSIAGIDHEADYRALTKDGSSEKDGHYIWIRDVVHVVRAADGSVDYLIGFMFDITERKQAEEKLAALQRELEVLSFRDGLTGVANRRMLDNTLETEWGSAKRDGRPLSLILVDIDYFKQFNDTYGHVEGDACLKRVGQALSKSATRPRDLCARMGGEEFALVLPDTPASGALLIAEQIRERMAHEAIPHAASLLSTALLTVSIGVGTSTPAQEDTLAAFVTKVDKRLYLAKLAGRNRVTTEDRRSSAPPSTRQA